MAKAHPDIVRTFFLGFIRVHILHHTAVAQYGDGGWTMEFSRKLVTGSDKDVQFSYLSQAYYFGVAIFDNAQVRHSFQTTAAALKFGQQPTAVASSSWGEVKQLMNR